MIELSVVIPVHNAAKFLDRCLKSILRAAKSTEVEIILVNNNSTDDSPQIIQKYAETHPKIIKSANCATPSAGAARNYGASRARGKYLWFIDADDTITKDSISLILNKLKCQNADLLMLGAKRLMQDGSESYLSAVSENDPNYRSRFIRYGMGPWQVVIRRAWWEKHHFEFKEGIIQEDMELMSSLILYTDNFVGLDQPLYYYYETPESVLHKRHFSPQVFDIFPALEGLLARFDAVAGAREKYSAELEWFFIWNLLIDSAKDFASFKEARPGFARSRAMLTKYFPSWRKNRFLRQKPLKFRLRVRLNYWK